MHSPNSLQLIQKILDDQELSSPYSGDHYYNPSSNYNKNTSSKLFKPKGGKQIQQRNGYQVQEQQKRFPLTEKPLFTNHNNNNYNSNYSQKSQNNHLQSQQQSTAQIIIQLDQQNKATIIIHKQDDPLNLAKKFCYQYNIDPRIINTLAKNIKDVKMSLENNNQREKQNCSNSRNVLRNSNNVMGDQKHSQRNSLKSSIHKHNASVSSLSRKSQKSQEKSQNKLKNSSKSKQNLQNFNKKPANNNNIQQYSQIYNSSILNNKLEQNNMMSKSTSKNNTNRLQNTSFQSIHHLHNTSQPKINSSNTVQRSEKIDTSMMSQKIKGYNNNGYNSTSDANPKIQNQYGGNQTYYHQSAKNSRSSIKNHQNRSVFDRLYQDSKNKKIKEKMATLAQQSTRKQIKQRGSIVKSLNNSQCSNFLYDKNTKLQQQTKRKNQILLQNKIDKQLQQCTHQPKINPISKIVAEKLRFDNNYNSRISVSNEKRNSRIISYIRERQQKELEECTFEPKLISKNKSQNFMTIEERCHLLHEDHNIRLAKQKQINQKLQMIQHSYQPKINNISKAIVQGRNFFDRLKEDQHHRKQRQALIQRTRKSQEKRKPSTGRAPLARNKGNMNVGQYLYQRHKSKLLENRSKSKSQQKIKHIIPKSQLIYEQRKKTSMRYLFALMDNDQDGYISATKIDINRLDQDILRLISPLLSQMQQIKAELDEQEFIQSFSRLFNTFSILQKNCIINIYKHPHSQSHLNQHQPSFHPQINFKSQTIVKEMQNRPKGVSLYDMWKQNFYQRQYKLQKIRAMKMHEEYQQCTFHPKLISKTQIE